MTPRTIRRMVAGGSIVGWTTAAFGVGAGFAAVPALRSALGYRMRTAIATSLLIIPINCSVVLYGRLHAADFNLSAAGFELRPALLFTFFALLGAPIGKHLALHRPERTLARWFTLLLAGIALYTAADAWIRLSVG